VSEPITVENVFQAAVRLAIKAALNLIQADPHQWSTRPCATCRAITKLIDEPFGCYAYSVEQKKKSH
jgi:hypothetical protein